MATLDERDDRLLRVPLERILIAGDMDPSPIETRTIRDPFRRPLDAFETCFDRLDRVGRTIADTLNHVGASA